MNEVILEVDSKITLKQYIADDADAIFQLIDDSRKHLSQNGDITAKKYPTVHSVRKSIANPNNPERLRLGIWDDDIFVGSINVTPNNQSDGLTAEIGYWLGKQYQGQDYINQSLKKLTEYIFSKTKFVLIYAIVHRKNDRSKRALIKCGFEEKESAAILDTVLYLEKK